MALIGNRSVLLKSPGRFFGGSTVSDNRSNFGTSGSTRGRFVGAMPATNATPWGYRPPYSWIIAIKNGEVSSVNNATMTIGASGAGAMGVNGAGSASITITMVGTGGLISSATGTAGITLSLTGGLFASKAAQGTATITLTPTGSVKGVGHMGGTAGCVLGASWTPYAKGWLSGTTEATGLSPSGIANAVWGKVIEAGYSADQILRILSAHAAGAATGLEGSNPQFTGLDGTTVRIDGTYTAGTRTIDALNGD